MNLDDSVKDLINSLHQLDAFIFVVPDALLKAGENAASNEPLWCVFASIAVKSVRVVIEMGFKKGRLALLDNSKLPTAVVKHSRIFLNRV